MFRGLGVLLLLIFAPAVATSGDHVVGPLRVSDPWSRALPPVASHGAVYLAVTNNGATPDRLVGAATAMAERVELHLNAWDGSVGRMRPVSAIDLLPWRTTVLEPAGLHLMLVGLKQVLVAGATFSLELEFEHAGRVHVQVEVRTAAATATGHSGH